MICILKYAICLLTVISQFGTDTEHTGRLAYHDSQPSYYTDETRIGVLLDAKQADLRSHAIPKKLFTRLDLRRKIK